MFQKVIGPRVSAILGPLVAVLAVTSTFVAPAAQTAALAASAPTTSSAPHGQAACASLMSVSLPNTTINSARDEPSGELPPPLPGFPPTPVVATCRVHATVTTPG